MLADDPAWASRARAFSAKVRDVSEVAHGSAAASPAPSDHGAGGVSRRLSPGAWPTGSLQPPPAASRASPALKSCRPAESEMCCGSAGIYNLVRPSRRGARRPQGRAHRRRPSGPDRDRQPRLHAADVGGVGTGAAALADPPPDRNPDASIRGVTSCRSTSRRLYRRFASALATTGVLHSGLNACAASGAAPFPNPLAERCPQTRQSVSSAKSGEPRPTGAR